jgi:hypothetical protein
MLFQFPSTTSAFPPNPAFSFRKPPQQHPSPHLSLHFSVLQSMLLSPSVLSTAKTLYTSTNSSYTIAVSRCGLWRKIRLVGRADRPFGMAFWASATAERMRSWGLILHVSLCLISRGSPLACGLRWIEDVTDARRYDVSFSSHLESILTTIA